MRLDCQLIGIHLLLVTFTSCNSPDTSQQNSHLINFTSTEITQDNLHQNFSTIDCWKVFLLNLQKPEHSSECIAFLGLFWNRRVTKYVNDMHNKVSRWIETFETLTSYNKRPLIRRWMRMVLNVYLKLKVCLNKYLLVLSQPETLQQKNKTTMKFINSHRWSTSANVFEYTTCDRYCRIISNLSSAPLFSSFCSILEIILQLALRAPMTFLYATESKFLSSTVNSTSNDATFFMDSTISAKQEKTELVNW